jgi:hypothetical protein
MIKKKKKRIRYLPPYTKLECKSGYKRKKGKNDEYREGYWCPARTEASQQKMMG